MGVICKNYLTRLRFSAQKLKNIVDDIFLYNPSICRRKPKSLLEIAESISALMYDFAKLRIDIIAELKKESDAKI